MNQLYKKLKDMDQHNLDLHFCAYCAQGDLDAVKYILSSPKLILHANPDAKKNKGFFFACQNGHLDLVRYLLVEQKISTIDINSDSDSALYSAINGGKLNIVKYLLESSELSKHASLHNADNEYIIRALASGGNLDIIKYILTELKNPLDVHIYNDSIFKITFHNENINVLEYLILDFGIDRTSAIDNLLKKTDKELSGYITKMFDKRDLHKDLIKEIAPNKLDNKKNKL